jgi:hypothetical protein
MKEEEYDADSVWTMVLARYVIYYLVEVGL